MERIQNVIFYRSLTKNTRNTPACCQQHAWLCTSEFPTVASSATHLFLLKSSCTGTVPTPSPSLCFYHKSHPSYIYWFYLYKSWSGKNSDFPSCFRNHFLFSTQRITFLPPFHLALEFSACDFIHYTWPSNPPPQKNKNKLIN